MLNFAVMLVDKKEEKETQGCGLMEFGQASKETKSFNWGAFPDPGLHFQWWKA